MEKFLREAYKRAYGARHDIMLLDPSDTWVNRAGGSLWEVQSNLEHLIRLHAPQLETELISWMESGAQDAWVATEKGKKPQSIGCHLWFGTGRPIDSGNCCGR